MNKNEKDNFSSMIISAIGISLGMGFMIIVPINWKFYGLVIITTMQILIFVMSAIDYSVKPLDDMKGDFSDREGQIQWNQYLLKMTFNKKE